MYACETKKNNDVALIVGTYTDPGSDGISVYDLNLETNQSSKKEELKLYNPSFLTLSKDNKLLFSITEGDSVSSQVYSYKIDENKKMSKIDSIHVGEGPCYITVDQYSSLGLTANYGQGSFSYFSIDNNGKLSDVNTIKFEGVGVDSIRQNQPHIHTVRISPDNKSLYITDLGTDHIYKYDLIDKGDKTTIDLNSLKSFKTPSGSGPRHLEFLPSLNKMYVLTELSGEILEYDIDSNGNLELRNVVKADDVDAAGSADIHITPNEKYLYSSHRLENDGISIFSIDEVDGSLNKIGFQKTGTHPRNFAITPEGNKILVANRDSDNIEIFKILENGLLEKQSEISNISKPVCVILLD